MTHTFARLEISAEAFDEIRAKLDAAGYSENVMADDDILELDMHGIGLTRGPATTPIANEKNPNHPVTARMRTEWHKLTAILVHKHGPTMITAADVQSMTGQNIVVNSKDAGLYLYLVDDKEADRLARTEGGTPH